MRTTVDARGLQCPLPVIELAREIAHTPVGGEVLLLASDPAADNDVPAWCRMRGHQLMQVDGAEDHQAYLVRRLV